MSAGRILVVDDEPQIRRTMRMTLTGAGYEVDDARTAEEGLKKLREFRPDLVLLDINMHAGASGPHTRGPPARPGDTVHAQPPSPRRTRNRLRSAHGGARNIKLPLNPDGTRFAQISHPASQ